MTSENKPQRTITDPVVMYDSMFEAGTSLWGSLTWLGRHADTAEEEQRWSNEAVVMLNERDAVPFDDMDAQWAMMLRLRARERELKPLIAV